AAGADQARPRGPDRASAAVLGEDDTGVQRDQGRADRAGAGRGPGRPGGVAGGPLTVVGSMAHHAVLRSASATPASVSVRATSCRDPSGSPSSSAAVTTPMTGVSSVASDA